MIFNKLRVTESNERLYSLITKDQDVFVDRKHMEDTIQDYAVGNTF
jgi:hypothetical protein